jgi:formyltetrahydrofolate-dependent phosphoribosylglycinamide formyltransferase
VTNPATTPDDRALIAVFLSGSGRTLVNLADCIAAGELPARIVLAVASRECLGAERARERNITTRVVQGDIAPAELSRLLEEAGAEWVALAGYTRLLPIPPGFEGRVVNIHPALLPKFGGPGMFGSRVHQAVIDAGETASGCTVHLCDDRYDTGPIVLQKRCPVLPSDTPEDLAARVFQLELEAYPEALRGLITGSLKPAAS